MAIFKEMKDITDEIGSPEPKVDAHYTFSPKPHTSLTNKQLYFYGLKALWTQVLGLAMAFVSVLGAVWYSIKGQIWWIPLCVLFIIGVVIWIKGRADRFDYKVRSGYLVHKGDIVF